MSYLNVTQLNKSYGPTTIFENIDFSADEGEFVTLLGPSGCGKSTLLRCIAGLTDVDSGTILLQGGIWCRCRRRNVPLAWCSRAMRCFRI